MFFTKRKEAQQKLLADKQSALLQGFDDSLQAADKLTDAGEKFLAYDGIGKSIGKSMTEDRTSEKEAFFRKIDLISCGISGVIAGPALIVALCLHVFPPFFAVGGATIVVVGALAGKAKKDARFEEADNSPFFEALKAHKTRAAQSAQNLLENNPDALARSPRFPTILEKVPALKNQFAAAFGRKAAAEAAAAQAQAAAAPAPDTVPAPDTAPANQLRL